MHVVPLRRAQVILCAVAILASACGSSTTDLALEPAADDAGGANNAADADDAAGGGDAGARAPDNASGLVPAAANAGEYYDEAYMVSNVGNFPSLDDPELINGVDATWIAPGDIVMGIVADNGEAQAYPINQMAYHHVANTRLAGEPFLVTY